MTHSLRLRWALLPGEACGVRSSRLEAVSAPHQSGARQALDSQLDGYFAKKGEEEKKDGEAARDARVRT